MIVLIEKKQEGESPLATAVMTSSPTPPTITINLSFTSMPFNFVLTIQGYPCRETCDEIEKACARELHIFIEFNICGFYPLQQDNPTCFRPVVTCPEPRAPTHGSVHYSDVTLWSEAVYECCFLFNLEGDRTRTCQVFLNFSLLPVKFYEYMSYTSTCVRQPRAIPMALKYRAIVTSRPNYAISSDLTKDLCYVKELTKLKVWFIKLEYNLTIYLWFKHTSGYVTLKPREQVINDSKHQWLL